jgi:UDP-glucose 4-epimerase
MERELIENRCIVVTGGAGFIGSHLIEALARDATNDILSIDNYFTGTRDNHLPGVEYIEGHTKDIERSLPRTPDLIFHLGEYSRVERSFQEPQLVWDLNMAGTFGVVEYCRVHGVKLVYAGSSTAFADGGLGRDQSPYAWSKAQNTELVSNYGRWYGLEHAITYFYNVYGPREISTGDYATLIGLFARQFRAAKPLTIVEPGTQRRNFTHVEDIIRGLLLVGEFGEGNDYGLGADESYSVLEIAELFGAEIEMLPERAGNRMDARLNTAKAKELGWRPRHSVADYIRGIVKPDGESG